MRILPLGRADAYLDTVRSIIRSPDVREFIIGYTSRSSARRLAEYRNEQGYQHLVVLADRLGQKDAHALERLLQDAVRQDKRSQMYQKYHPVKRDGRYYRSAGKNTADPVAKVHSVYIAWRHLALDRAGRPMAGRPSAGHVTPGGEPGGHMTSPPEPWQNYCSCGLRR